MKRDFADFHSITNLVNYAGQTQRGLAFASRIGLTFSIEASLGSFHILIHIRWPTVGFELESLDQTIFIMSRWLPAGSE